MQKDSSTMYLVGGLIIAVAIVGAVVYMAKKSPASRELDSFATCLKDQGAVFYGAFWCPHCLATKKLFGRSADKLPYVECSTPDGNGQTPACAEKKIESYPTWEFKDGSRLTGELTLETLSAKTSCPITPGGSVSTSTVATSTVPAMKATSTLQVQ
jgi:hypothetical protein